MCAERKQILKSSLALFAGALTLAGVAFAEGAGGVAIGDGAGGITDRAFVQAPPNYLYVVERERGSFLDCGEGQDDRSTDEDGRDVEYLRCVVTLTETVVIPAAASSARIIVHY